MKINKKFGITIEKRIHMGWLEYERIKKNKDLYEAFMKLSTVKPMGHFHKWQYVYSSKKGRISYMIIIALENMFGKFIV